MGAAATVSASARAVRPEVRGTTRDGVPASTAGASDGLRDWSRRLVDGAPALDRPALAGVPGPRAHLCASIASISGGTSLHGSSPDGEALDAAPGGTASRDPRSRAAVPIAMGARPPCAAGARKRDGVLPRPPP